jgi:hypothetical protein
MYLYLITIDTKYTAWYNLPTTLHNQTSTYGITMVEHYFVLLAMVLDEQNAVKKVCADSSISFTK